MVSKEEFCFKYILFAFNLVFIIFGILLVYSGFKTKAKISDYKEVIIDSPNNVVISLIVVGFLIFLIAFLGCLGAIKERLQIYLDIKNIIRSIILVFVLVISAALIFNFRSNLKQFTEKSITTAIMEYNTTESNDLAINKVLDDIQTHLKCFGANNYSDWLENHEYNKTHALPYSCCASHTVIDHCSKDHAYQLGCVNAIDDEIRGSFSFLGGIAIANAIIKLFGIIFS